MFSRQNAISVYIDYNDQVNPFSIQPRCRVRRMVEVIQQALGIEINDIVCKHLGNEYLHITTNDYDKYLIEDMHIRQNDTIVIRGNDVGNAQLDNYITIILKHEMFDVDVKITNHTITKDIIDILKQSKMLLINTIQLQFNNVPLLEYENLMSTYGIKKDDVITVF